MAEFIKTQNTFADGEVAPEFYALDNINGLSKLENMDVLSGGGLSRRGGLESVYKLDGPARLIPFSESDTHQYIIALTDMRMQIFHNGNRMQSIIAPWGISKLANIQYAQRFGTMIFVHPDFPPQVLRKSGDYFTLSEFAFSRNDSDMTLNVPFVRFDDAADIKITVTTNSNGNNYATFTTSADFWTPENVGGRLYLLDKQWYIHEYISPTQIVAYTNGAYSVPSASVSDWRESAFGTRRGWPRSITFHQDRLVFGGTHDWPGGIWMSRVGNHTNFDTGTGLDDEAIFISLLSQQRQQICTVVSSDNLQILTNDGEWAISSRPLTPSSLDVRQHTSVGSYTNRYLPPQRVEGSTVFVSRSGTDIRELCLDDFGERYNATDLCPMAKHLLSSPIDIAYNATTRQLFVVRSDGVMAVLNQNAALGISAWGTYTTYGEFLSVGVCDGITYVLVRRQGTIYLECFDINVMHDGPGHDFTCIACGLPLRIGHHNARKIRIRKITARITDTKSLSINMQRLVLPNAVQSDDSPGYSGDVSVNLLGTTTDVISPLWTLHSAECKPVTVLSVTVHGRYDV